MTTMRYVFIYCRISADQHGHAEGVAAQEKWGRAYATMHWPGLPIKVFSDNDLSAAKDDVYRPEFEEMREAIRRGECGQLWAVEQNRLTRLEPVWFGLAAELIRHGVTQVHTKRNGVIDVDGVVAGIMAVLGAHEVKQLRGRLLDKKAELASEGRPGGRIGFGYRQVLLTDDEERRLREWQERRHQAKIRGKDMRLWKQENPRPPGGKAIYDEQGRKIAQIVPKEAEIIRECAKRILNGWGLTNVATWLNEQELRGKHGGRFVATSVADFLTAPCVAGFRVHRGEIVGRATWEPILDETTWRAVCAVVNTRKKMRYRSRRVNLLTGYRLFCGICDKPMQTRANSTPEKIYSYYACEPKVTDGCGRTTIGAPETEAHVAVQIFQRLEEQDAAGLLATQDHNAARRVELVERLQGVETRRAELSQMWSARAITTEQFTIMNDSLTGEQQALGHELSAIPAPVQDVDPRELRAAWPEMPLDERRKIVDDWIEKITVHYENRSRQSNGRPTQKTVAAKAGVSQGFVSRVVLGKAPDSALAARVRAVIAELDYEPGPGKYRRPTANTDRVEITWRR